MKAARLHATEDIRVAEEADPTPAEDESLVRVGAVGLCGSDLHWFSEGGIGDARIERPGIPGHEMGGVALDGPYAGQVVAIDPALPCRACERCLEGNVNLCPNVKFSGQGATEGGMSELMTWPTHALFPLPEGMTVEDAALLEPLGVATHAWDLGHVRLGARVAVVAAGPIGLFLVQLAAHGLTTRVSVVEPLEHRRRAALSMGADDAVDPAELESLGLFDVVFEASGSPEAVTETMQLARPGGRVVLAGIPDEDVTSFPAGNARRKGLTIAIVRRMKEVYPRAIALAQRGLVDLPAMVTHRFPLDQVDEAFRLAATREGLKVVVRPDGSTAV